MRCSCWFALALRKFCKEMDGLLNTIHRLHAMIFAGIRMLDGKATDTIEGSSLSYRSEYIDIYSCCWGPKDDGKRFGKPGHLASKALQIGTQRVKLFRSTMSSFA